MPREEVVKGGVEPTTFRFFRRIRGVAAGGWMRPAERSSWGNHGLSSLGVARRLPTLARRIPAIVATGWLMLWMVAVVSARRCGLARWPACRCVRPRPGWWRRG